MSLTKAEQLEEYANDIGMTQEELRDFCFETIEAANKDGEGSYTLQQLEAFTRRYAGTVKWILMNEGRITHEAQRRGVSPDAMAEWMLDDVIEVYEDESDSEIKEDQDNATGG